MKFPCIGSIVLLAVSTSLLSGCGAPAPESGTVVYWRTLTGSAGDAQDALAERFNAAHAQPQVTVEFQGGYGDLATKLKTAAIAGAGPDLAQLGTFEIREFAEAGLLVDLRPYIDGDAGLDTADWPETFLSAGMVDGGIYWLPFNVTVPILYYNAEALAEAGFDGPPETWEAFFEMARATTLRDANGRVVRHGVALWDITWPLISAIWSEGGALTDRSYDNVTLDDPVAVSVLEAFQALVRDGTGVMPDKAAGGHRAVFKSGRAAMILDSPAPLREILDQSQGFTPRVAAYPAGKAGRVYAPGGGGLAIMSVAADARRADAWTFMRYLLAPENLAFYAQESGYVAFTQASRDQLGAETATEPYATIYAALPHVRADFSINMSPAVRTAFDDAYRAILAGMADVRTTLAEADAKAEAALASGR